MKKYSVMAGLGDFYGNNTGYSRLKFTLKNVTDFSDKLKVSNWETAPALFDKTSEKTIIQKKLEETIGDCKENDWLLFYYTGHASRYWVEDANGGRPITYCVTYSENLKSDLFPGLQEFFTEIDYDSLIQLFHQKVPNGHLITILDCCHAFGLVENFASQTAYHSVIAASSAGSSAAYNQNSSFFKAFQQCWDLPFDQMGGRIRSKMINMSSPNVAKVQIATNFITQSLNV